MVHIPALRFGGRRARHGLRWALLTLVLLACHEAPRNNPFDPALTPAVELLSVVVDDTSGTATLTWTAYAGEQPFAFYRVLRREPELVRVDTLKVIKDMDHTTFQDSTLVPGKAYVYWVTVVNQRGFEVKSSKELEALYHLPPVELIQAEFDYLTATAELVWTRYRGPGFEAYEVHRQAEGIEGLTEQVVETVTDTDRTRYTDTQLEGNTPYTYWISVRTRWEVDALSNEVQGGIYLLDRERTEMVTTGTFPARGVGLTMDERNDLHVAIIRGTDQLFLKSPGISPQVIASLFWDMTVERDSRVLVAAGHGRVYSSVAVTSGETYVGAQVKKPLEVGEGFFWSRIWEQYMDIDGAFPVGLALNDDGDIVLVDTEGRLYHLSATDGTWEGPDDRLGVLLYTPPLSVMPLRQVVIDDDRFFCMGLGGPPYLVYETARLPDGEFSIKWTPYGTLGASQGKLLNPVAFTFDAQDKRLFVLDILGRVQVFETGGKPQYVTQWGGYGERDGEFVPEPPRRPDMAVDSEGRVYVADIVGDHVRIQVFKP